MAAVLENPQLLFRLEDFGARFTESGLEVPPMVAKVFFRMGVRNAALLIPMMRSQPSSFLHELKLTINELVLARTNLAALLTQNGITWNETPPPQRAFGAMPPPLNPAPERKKR